MRTGDVEHEWIQLERFGVPLEPMTYRVRPKHGLLIRTGRSTIFPCKLGCVHCVVNVFVTDNMPSKTLLMGADLRVPSVSLRFTWLPSVNETGTDVGCYSFHSDGHWLDSHQREGVINPYLDGGIALKRGDVMKGVLLGSAALPGTLPARFAHFSNIPAELAFWDQFDNWHSAQFLLHVDRSAELSERVRGPSERASSISCALVAPDDTQANQS